MDKSEKSLLVCWLQYLGTLPALFGTHFFGPSPKQPALQSVEKPSLLSIIVFQFGLFDRNVEMEAKILFYT